MMQAFGMQGFLLGLSTSVGPLDYLNLGMLRFMGFDLGTGACRSYTVNSTIGRNWAKQALGIERFFQPADL